MIYQPQPYPPLPLPCPYDVPCLPQNIFMVSRSQRRVNVWGPHGRIISNLRIIPCVAHDKLILTVKSTPKFLRNPKVRYSRFFVIHSFESGLTLFVQIQCRLSTYTPRIPSLYLAYPDIRLRYRMHCTTKYRYLETKIVEEVTLRPRTSEYFQWSPPLLTEFSTPTDVEVHEYIEVVGTGSDFVETKSIEMYNS